MVLGRCPGRAGWESEHRLQEAADHVGSGLQAREPRRGLREGAEL